MSSVIESSLSGKKEKDKDYKIHITKKSKIVDDYKLYLDTISLKDKSKYTEKKSVFAVDTRSVIFKDIEKIHMLGEDTEEKTYPDINSLTYKKPPYYDEPVIDRKS